MGSAVAAVLIPPDAEVESVKVAGDVGDGKGPDATKIVVLVVPETQELPVWQTPQATIETELPIAEPPPVEPR